MAPSNERAAPYLPSRCSRARATRDRLRKREINRVTLCKIRRHKDIQQAALTHRMHSGHTRQWHADFAVSADDTHLAGALGHQHAPHRLARQERNKRSGAIKALSHYQRFGAAVGRSRLAGCRCSLRLRPSRSYHHDDRHNRCRKT